MSLPVELLSGADADLQKIFNRFEDYRKGFGVEFMTVIDAYLARIAVFPENCANLLREHSPTGDTEISIRHLLRASTHKNSGDGDPGSTAG